MNIKGAWYTDELPNYVVIERTDGTLAKYFMTPFRHVGEGDLTIYKGYHPSKRAGQILPAYLLRLYGLKSIVAPISIAAVELGRKGGASTSMAKQMSSRENGKKGGRPRKDAL